MIRRLVKLDGATKNEHIGILRNLDPDKHFYQKTRVFWNVCYQMTSLYTAVSSASHDSDTNLLFLQQLLQDLMAI